MRTYLSKSLDILRTSNKAILQSFELLVKIEERVSKLSFIGLESYDGLVTVALARDPPPEGGE